MSLSYLLVHFWLSKLWFINLIVSILSVTDQVNQNVSFPLFLIVNTKVHHSVNVFNILWVHVNNWSVKGLCDITAVLRTSWVDRSRCVTQLVVGDDVNGSSNVEFRYFSQNKRLINNSLTTDSGVTVDLNVQDFVRSMIMLFRSGLSHGHRVLGLQMRWIMNHGYFQVLPIVFLDNTLRNMRSHIINDSVQLLRGISFSTDLSEQVSRLILQNVSQ